MKYLKRYENFIGDCKYPPTVDELLNDDEVMTLKKAKEAQKEREKEEDEAAEKLAMGFYSSNQQEVKDNSDTPNIGATIQNAIADSKQK